jgi:hypothetical protein
LVYIGDMSETTSNWYDVQPIVYLSEANGIDTTRFFMDFAALAGKNGPRYTLNIDIESSLVELAEYLKAKGFRLIFSSKLKSTYGSARGLIKVFEKKRTKTNLQLQLHLNDKDLLSEIEKDFLLLKPKSRGLLQLLTKTSMGFEFTTIGLASIPLDRKNYTESNLKDFDYIVQSLQDPDPCGRLVLLEGKAGTGKTYFTRGLLEALPFENYYYLPSEMVVGVTSPDTLRSWLTLENKPIVIIVEDADACLAPRKSDNIASIQSLLNLTDGMLGSLLDIRVICTTNAKRVEIDEALLRNGRLCRHVKIDSIGSDHAQRIYEGLIPGGTFQSSNDTKTIGFKSRENSFTLADIYQAARDNGWRHQAVDLAAE